MKILLLLVTFIATTSVHALDIDEKLTVRFLKVSDTKKTILINRGAEDGLVIGDHAKFFITSGVIARGIVEKVSPSRSIWALYRVVDATEVTDGKVLNLKISSPVKVTDDPSKSMKEEEIPAGTDKLDMSEVGSETSNVEVSTDEQNELDSMVIDESENTTKKEKSGNKKVSTKKMPIVQNDSNEFPEYGTNTSKNWEIWGTLYLNSLSGTVDNGTSNTTSTGKTSSMIDFSGGIERYFLNSDSFLKNTSLVAFVHKRTYESGSDIKISTDWFEFGGGLNYHFYNSAAAINTLIGFGSINAGTGSSNNNEVVVTNGTSTENPVKGTSMFYSAGVGAKYILKSGFGIRALLDYYSTTESYDYEDSTTTSNLSGPRILFGLSYRF